MLKIAHISDLHFFKLSFNPLLLLSKRLIGTLNHLISRRLLHDTTLAERWLNTLKANGVTHVVITGDLSTTSLKKEFIRARSYIEEIKKRGITVFALPGNHDCYTPLAQYYRSFFYNLDGAVPFQSDDNLPFHLEEDGVSAHRLIKGIWLVQLDTTHATPPFRATGTFKMALEERLEKLFARLPKNDKIILACHFPFFQHVSPSSRLVGGERLERLLRDRPNVILYLHGHTHRQTLADMRADDLPIVLDSGSLTQKKNGGWNLITLNQDGLEKIEAMTFQDETWVCHKALEVQCP